MQSTSGPKPRKLRPREAVTTSAFFVSQLTCVPLLGIDARRYLDLVREHDLPRTRVGKLVLVEVRVISSLLSHLAVDGDSASTEPTVVVDDDDEPTTVDGVLARIGRVST